METDQPDQDLNTTYEIIDQDIDIKQCQEKKPIFSITLKYQDQKFFYSSEVEDCKKNILDCFDLGLEKACRMKYISFETNKKFSNAKYFRVLFRNVAKKEKKKENETVSESNKKKDKKSDFNKTTKDNQLDPNQQEYKLDPKFDPNTENFEFVQTLYDRLGECLMYAEKPLKEFLSKFECYTQDLELNIEE